MTRDARIFPLGARGERPVFIASDVPWSRARQILDVPGVQYTAGLGFSCGWDASWSVAKLLGIEPPVPPLEENLTDEQLLAEVLALPGYPRYRALGLHSILRKYQKQDIIWMARRAFLLNANPMRSGKTLECIAAAELRGVTKTLIIPPALAKLVWAEEIAKFAQEEAVLLEGRACKTARVFCRACMGTGRDRDERGDPIEGTNCTGCKLRNGQSTGLRLLEVLDVDRPVYQDVKPRYTPIEWTAAGGFVSFCCPKHREIIARRRLGPVQGPDGRMYPALFWPCPRCQGELVEAIGRARWVICNYDLLIGQAVKTGEGVKFFRNDLPGWVPFLAKFRFELAIGDESHSLRGFTTDQRSRGQTRRDRFNAVCDPIAMCWLVTGTPIFGFVRDLWGQLDAMTRGLFSAENRMPFQFHSRYCNGHKGNYGWEANGKSVYFDGELRQRMRFFMLQRARKEILPEMPGKIRQKIRIEGEVAESQVRRIALSEGNKRGKISKLLEMTAKTKEPYVIENVLAEMAEGNKVVVFTRTHANAARIGKALEKAVLEKDNRTRMAEVKAKIWITHGPGEGEHGASAQARKRLADAFCRWHGAAAFVVTEDSVQVAVSLYSKDPDHPTTAVHFADLHDQYGALHQAEERPYEKGLNKGLAIVYYIVKGTIDEHIESIVLPKVALAARLADEGEAEEMRAALAAADKKESSSEILDRLCAHLARKPVLAVEDWEEDLAV